MSIKFTYFDSCLVFFYFDICIVFDEKEKYSWFKCFISIFQLMPFFSFERVIYSYIAWRILYSVCVSRLPLWYQQFFTKV